MSESSDRVAVFRKLAIVGSLDTRLAYLEENSTGAGGYVATAPPAGMYPVTNLFWDPVAQKMEAEYDDQGGSSGTIISTPPQGSYQITNVYYDPANESTVGEYEDA